MRRIATTLLVTTVLAGCPAFTAEETGTSSARPTPRAEVRVQAAAQPGSAAQPRPALRQVAQQAAQKARPVQPPAPQPAAPPQGDRVSARHVLIQYQGSQSANPSITRSKDEARTRAAEVMRRARAGEDFQALAREMSDGPSGPRGGDLGTFGRGRMVPPFDRAAFELDVNGISDIVETPFGFHVIQRYQ